jgi:hypothetical protein
MTTNSPDIPESSAPGLVNSSKISKSSPLSECQIDWAILSYAEVCALHERRRELALPDVRMQRWLVMGDVREEVIDLVTAPDVQPGNWWLDKFVLIFVFDWRYIEGWRDGRNSCWWEYPAAFGDGPPSRHFPGYTCGPSEDESYPERLPMPPVSSTADWANRISNTLNAKGWQGYWPPLWRVPYWATFHRKAEFEQASRYALAVGGVEALPSTVKGICRHSQVSAIAKAAIKALWNVEKARRAAEDAGDES